ncbi:hypothetical protein Barb4_02671 [Bacteroidales bacterium Barb4]|nr:hypothetical protein Barb4_02671 [Bacteroidales bacterium Barb4]
MYGISAVAATPMPTPHKKSRDTKSCVSALDCLISIPFRSSFQDSRASHPSPNRVWNPVRGSDIFFHPFRISSGRPFPKPHIPLRCM